MNRREAVKTATFLVGGLLIGCTRDQNLATGKVLSIEDQTLIEEIADTLLPATASPGARAAGAGAAINLLLTDCYEPEEQQRVVHGLQEFRTTCARSCGGNFESASQSAREHLLRVIDVEALKNPQHYFRLVRNLSHQAYFSSQTGMTRARRYMQTPGKWIGCMPLKPGQRSWA
jgi:hypothetical protein